MTWNSKTDWSGDQSPRSVGGGARAGGRPVGQAHAWMDTAGDMRPQGQQSGALATGSWRAGTTPSLRSTSTPGLLELVLNDPLLKAAVAIAGLVLLYQLTVMVVRPHWLPNATDWLRMSASWVEWILLALATYALYRARRPGVLAWLMFTLAMLSYAIAQSLRDSLDLFVVPGNVPFPSWPDLFYLLQYPFFFAAFALLPGVSRKGQPGVTRAKVVLDSMLLMAAGTALSWYFFLAPAYNASMETGIAKAVNLAYPVGDLGLLFGLAVVLSRQGRSSTGRVALHILIAAVVALIAADSWYAYGRAYSTVVSGDPPDGFWITCYLLFALAGLVQYRIAGHGAGGMGSEGETSQITTASVTGGFRLLLPFIAAVLASAILVMRAATAPIGSSSPTIPFAVSLGLLVLVGARQGITVLENERLLRNEQGRVEELALANQVADEQRRLLAERNRRLEQDIEVLKDVHARVARGDYSARAPISSGELLPIAGSLNIMLDRLSNLMRANADRSKLDQAIQVVVEAAQGLAVGDDRALNGLTAPTNTPLDGVAIALSQLRARIRELNAGLRQLEQARRASRELADIAAQQGQFITNEGTAMNGIAGSLSRLALELERVIQLIEQTPGYTAPVNRPLAQAVGLLHMLVRAIRQQISDVETQMIRFAQGEERANLAAIGGRRLAAELDAAARVGGSKVTLGVPGMPGQGSSADAAPLSGSLARASTKPMMGDPRFSGSIPTLRSGAEQMNASFPGNTTLSRHTGTTAASSPASGPLGSAAPGQPGSEGRDGSRS